MESTLLVEREEFDKNRDVARTVYVRPITTNCGSQYKVGGGSYTIIGAKSHFTLTHASTLTPQSFSSFERRLRSGIRGQLPPVPEVLECSLLEISSDDNSITNTALLHSNFDGGTMIVSSPIDLEIQASQPWSVNSLQSSSSSIGVTPSSHPLRDPGVSHISSAMEAIRTSLNSTLQSEHSNKNQIASESNCVREVSNVPPLCTPHPSNPDSYPIESLGMDLFMEEEKSIYESLIALGNEKTSKSELKSVDLASFPQKKLKYLPTEYNGNVLFELPRLFVVKGGGGAILDGMDRRCDGHV